MPKIDLEELELADRIARLSDDVMLTAAEAAAYLRVSIRTMERMRAGMANGAGPRYRQVAQPGSTGGNQHVRYRLGDLREWASGYVVTSNVEAAVKRGLL